MLLKDIIQLLDATIYFNNDETILEKDFDDAFASDLMSDALALIQEDCNSILFITGLANVQAIRTAEMLDLSVIMYVRGKKPDQTQIDLAKNMGITLIGVKYNMFTACGKLYTAGLNHD